MLILESLPEDIHVEHAEEPTPEAATQGRTRLILHLDATISQAELGQRLLQVFVIVWVLWVDARIDNCLCGLVAREWLNLCTI